MLRDKKDKLENVRSQLPQQVRLVVVSKYQPNSSILELYETGHRIFGESKVQELLAKYESLPQNIEWHFIGHLQTNKVKFIVPFVALIHGVDSLKLLHEINDCAEKAGKTVNCLLQMHIAKEESKFGFSFDELDEILQTLDLKTLSNIRICGLMGMASNTEDMTLVKNEFKSLAQYFAKLKSTYFADNDSFIELSMGMSSDYDIAIKEGATLIRIGSSIFNPHPPSRGALNRPSGSPPLEGELEGVNF